MRKPFAIIAAILSLLGGLYLGPIGIFGGTLAAYFLVHYGVVAPDSAWVSETKGTRIAKYVLLAIVLLGLLGLASIVFFDISI